MKQNQKNRYQMRPKRWVNKNGVCYFQIFEGLYQLTFALDENLTTVVNNPTFTETAIDIIFIMDTDMK